MQDNRRFQQQPPQNTAFSGNREVTAAKGVKLKNKNAEKAEQERVDRQNYKQQFELNADKTVEYQNEKTRKSVEVISKFLNLSQDKTLPRNKGAIAKDVEKEIRQELLNFTIELNNDENEDNMAYGSVIAINVLLKIILLQRDRLNEIEYEIESLKKNAKASSQNG
jgi:uncharacterized protein (UPF0147 family)